MPLPRKLFFVLPFVFSGCFLLDKLDENTPEVYDPGTEPVSKAFDVNPANELDLATPAGVGLKLPPDALVTNTGAPPEGYISIVLTNHVFGLTQPWNMPGGLFAENAAGQPGALTSFGAIEITLADVDGNPLYLRNGVSGQIEIPALPGGPATIPLWYLDETRNVWLEDGSATLVDDKYVGSVFHFTKWNADIFANRACIEGDVLDGNSGSVIGTIVTAELASGPGLSGGQAYTDAQGHYRIEGLSGGSTYQVIAFGKDCSDITEITLPSSGETCVMLERLTLKNGALPADGADPDLVGFAGSCDSKSAQGLCVDYTGSEFTSESVSSACAGYTPPATYFTSPCSRISVVAICTQNQGQPNEIVQVFDAEKFTVETASTACTAVNGVLTAL